MSTDIEATISSQQEAAEKTWVGEFLKGPTRTRWASLPPQVGDAAPDLVLPDTAGDERRLSEWWSQGTVHLVFLRHFGCGCLADRWAELRSAAERIELAGATTVAIGQAEPERSGPLGERRGYTFPLLSDPDRVAYAEYGLLDGEVATVAHDEAWSPDDRQTADKMAASRRGSERALVDHPWQLPGEFIIARGGRIVLAHRSQFCEDFPPTTVLLGAIAAAKA